MSSHISYIIWKAQEANPALLKLSFGCEMQYWDEVVKYTNQCDEFYYFVVWDKECCVRKWYKESMKLLGHPIQLSDILLALGENYAIDWTWEFYEPLITHNHWRIFERTGILYDISLPLTEQTHETIQWIAESLGYNS